MPRAVVREQNRTDAGCDAVVVSDFKSAASDLGRDADMNFLSVIAVAPCCPGSQSKTAPFFIVAIAATGSSPTAFSSASINFSTSAIAATTTS